VEAREQRGGEPLPVEDEGAGEARIEDDAEGVDRRAEGGGLGDHAAEQAGGAAVGAQHVVAAVDHHHGVGLLLRQHAIEDRADGPREPVIDVQLLEGVGEAGRVEEGVLIAQRHRERRREAEDHLAARLGAAGLEEADVARRDVGGEREVELAETAAGAPVLDQGRKEVGTLAAHDRSVTPAGPAVAYLGR
jgi:hypothetical protein